MKIRLFGLLALVALLATAMDADAQRPKPRPAKKPAAAAQVVETPVVAPPPPPPPADTIPLRPFKESRRPSSTVVGNNITEKTPLAYDNIRIDDQVYRQVIWRIIDTREKINLPFMYAAEEENGSQMFVNILLKHIKDGDITAFDNVDDRFSTPLSVEAVAKLLSGSSYDVDIPDVDADPTGTLGITKRVTIREEFDELTIRSFAVKEEVIFDKETSRLHFRILGIAPRKTILETDGTERATFNLFWVYYPDIRPYLSKYEAYNPRNMGARMSWEEVFESRYFSSYIYKSTLNNPFNKTLEGIQSDPLMRLLEGERIKETIFNWEQDQWSY